MFQLFRGDTRLSGDANVILELVMVFQKINKIEVFVNP